MSAHHIKATVVTADDHPVVLAGLREVIAQNTALELIGEAQSSADLVRLMHLHEADIVICDYNMPIGGRLSDGDPGDGIQLISYLSDSFVNSRVLVLTMVSCQDIIARMFRAGASAVVCKRRGLRELDRVLTALAREE